MIDTNEILKWDIEQLWNMIQMLEDSGDLDKDDYELIKDIKNGFKIKIPIQYIIQEWYEVYPNNKRAKVLGHGKYALLEFIEEIENRSKIMRNIILENLQEEKSTEPR